MEARYQVPHILNPPISGFSPMLHHQTESTDSLPYVDGTNTTASTDVLPETSQRLDNPRKRPLSRIKSSYPRKRAIQACQKCRARRTKCDNIRPTCSSCEDLGVECNYSEGDPSSYDAASLAILEKLSTIENLLRADGPESHRKLRASLTEEAPQDASPASHVKSLNSPTLERTRDPVLCHMNIENVLSWPAFENEAPNLDLKTLLNEHNVESPLNASNTDLDHSVSEEELVQRFLDEVFIFNPVLEEAKVHKYVRDARYNGIGWDAQSCLLLLIYAHGALLGAADPALQANDASDARQRPQFKQAESYFLAAQRRLGLLLCRSGVIEAQCFFLAGVYLMACIRPLEAWKMFVQALACCQSFYNGKSRSLGETESHRRLKESIYWTCFKSELELRLELNVSDSSVWDLTYPSFFPSPPDELKSQREVVWYFYLAEIALRRLGNRVLNYIYSAEALGKGTTNTSGASMIESILGFEQQAADWIKSLPRGLELDASSPGVQHQDQSELHTTLKFILIGHLLDCYEMMYWPFIAESLNGGTTTSTPKSPHIMQDRNTENGFVRKALNVCVDRIAKNEPGFCYRHHGTWLMLRSCTRSALVLLASSRSEKLRNMLPDNWRDSVLKVTNMLRFWHAESKDVRNRLELIDSIMSTNG